MSKGSVGDGKKKAIGSSASSSGATHVAPGPLVDSSFQGKAAKQPE